METTKKKRKSKYLSTPDEMSNYLYQDGLKNGFGSRSVNWYAEHKRRQGYLTDQEQADLQKLYGMIGKSSFVAMLRNSGKV